MRIQRLIRQTLSSQGSHCPLRRHIYTNIVFITVELGTGVPKYGNSKGDSRKTSGEKELRE